MIADMLGYRPGGPRAAASRSAQNSQEPSGDRDASEPIRGSMTRPKPRVVEIGIPRRSRYVTVRHFHQIVTKTDENRVRALDAADFLLDVGAFRSAREMVRSKPGLPGGSTEPKTAAEPGKNLTLGSSLDTSSRGVGGLLTASTPPRPSPVLVAP